MEIDCHLSPAATAPFEVWLKQHGRRLKNTLSGLQSITLEYFRLPAINSTSTTTQLLPHLEHLEHLHLSFCRLALLVTSTRLTALVVEGGTFAWGDAQQEQLRFNKPLCDLLPQLALLRMPLFSLSHAVVKRFARMQRLQSLEFDTSQLHSCAGWHADLPSSLTKLVLRNLGAGSQQQPQLQHLTNLQVLQFVHGPVPSDLGPMTQLRVLSLIGCTVAGWPDGGEPSAAATAAFLAGLQQLKQLSHLSLEAVALDTGVRPLQQWSALTAATGLTRLDLQWMDPQPLPVLGGAQVVFSARRPLPHLRVLSLSTNEDDNEHERCLDGDDLNSIVGCCPSLVELQLVSTVREGADLTPLCRLPPCLTLLAVGGDAVTDAVAVPVMLQLTQLQELHVVNAPGFTDTGLQQLTALKGVTKLEVAFCQGVSSRIWAAASPSGDGDEDAFCLTQANEEVCSYLWLQGSCTCLYVVSA